MWRSGVAEIDGRGTRAGGCARRRLRTGLIMGAVVLIGASGPARAVGQIPDTFRNLRVLPEDIGRDSLVLLMRSFSFATGLRCEGCHVMGEDGAFQGARFDLDEKPTKRVAREMLRLVAEINERVQAIPADHERLLVECKTCHRGLARPHLLRTEIREIIMRDGIDAGLARYRELRENERDSGAYDFGIWETMELARELEVAGMDAEAAAVLELNEEYHPRSSSIPREAGRVYERLGRTDDAIAAYRRTLGLNPADTGTLERLRALTGGSGPSA